MPLSGPLYPVNLVLEGRLVLVVGAGQVALRKVEGLLEAGAEVLVVAPEVAPELEALPVEIRRRRYEPADLEGAWLVVAATDDPLVNRQVFEDGCRRRVWVNAVDQPDSCSVTLPAVMRRGPVSVAVSTSGHSPALSGWLKDQIQSQFGPELAQLAELLSEARQALKARGVSTEGIDWRRALDADMLAMIRSGRTEQARELIEACLS